MHYFDSNVKGLGGWGVGGVVGGGGQRREKELHFGIYNKEVFRRKFN